MSEPSRIAPASGIVAKVQASFADAGISGAKIDVTAATPEQIAVVCYYLHTWDIEGIPACQAGELPFVYFTFPDEPTIRPDTIIARGINEEQAAVLAFYLDNAARALFQARQMAAA